ncbi:MAG TPA: hypothetical protein VF189_04940 [Patescibacteria group bacterium]
MNKLVESLDRVLDNKYRKKLVKEMGFSSPFETLLPEVKAYVLGYIAEKTSLDSITIQAGSFRPLFGRRVQRAEYLARRDWIDLKNSGLGMEISDRSSLQPQLISQHNHGVNVAREEKALKFS